MLGLATWIALVSSASDFALAAWVLLRGKERRLGMARIVSAVIAITVSGGAKLIIAVGIAHSFFLAIHLVYSELMLVVPLSGIAVICAARHRPVTLPVRILAWSSLALVPIVIDATFIEPYRLVTETARISVPAERALSRPIVIAVIADLQCTSVTDRERDVVARVMAAHPDLILLPGDLQQAGFDHRDEIAAQLRPLFAPLSAPMGVWYVEGNTETTAEARHLLEGTPVRILENEIVHLDRDGSRVTLCGVDLGLRSTGARDRLRSMQTRDDEGDLRILLAHRPDAVLTLEPHSRIDLVISGHTHGGQVQFPWFGPLITLSRVPRAVAAGGLHRVADNAVYVSRGIGWEHGHAPRVRFLCAPEVSVLTIERTSTTD
jgi:predicted MPP superfamily phosphohydrolase